MPTTIPMPTATLKPHMELQRETESERRARENRSLEVAREMLNNGCSINAVIRYTGLNEEQIRQMSL